MWWWQCQSVQSLKEFQEEWGWEGGQRLSSPWDYKRLGRLVGRRQWSRRSPWELCHVSRWIFLVEELLDSSYNIRRLLAVQVDWWHRGQEGDMHMSHRARLVGVGGKQWRLWQGMKFVQSEGHTLNISTLELSLPGFFCTCTPFKWLFQWLEWEVRRFSFAIIRWAASDLEDLELEVISSFACLMASRLGEHKRNLCDVQDQ